MVIGERHALLGAPFAELGDAFWHRLSSRRRRASAWWRAASCGRPGWSGRPRHRRCKARSTALNRSIIGWMRSLFAASSSSTSVPENQPPQSVTSAAFRIGSMTSGSFGKAAAHLHAGEARRTRLAQAFLQRHVIAEFRQIVVPPRDGGHAQFGFHVVTPVSDRPDASAGQMRPASISHPLQLHRFLIGLARRLTCLRELTSGTATSHQWPPASVEISGSVSMTITVVRLVLLRPSPAPLRGRRSTRPSRRSRRGSPRARRSRSRAGPRAARP